jgi:exodeoxyribonuclease V beta subunit
LRVPLEALQAANEGAIELRDLNATPAGATAFTTALHAAAPLRARRLDVAPPKPWRISSFSGLISAQEREAPDYDAIEQLDTHAVARAASEDLFGLPGGMQTGTLIHQLFEAIDFRHPASTQISALVRRKMTEFGLDPRWTPVLEKMLADVTATPLDEAVRLRLNCIAPAQRLVELEFLFPVGDVRLQALREALQPLRRIGSRLPDAIGELILAPSRGYIRGFIDLAFEFEGRYYLADYKSNYLGAHIEDYAPAQLSEAMSASWYDLQYLLYSVALHRHLRLHLVDYDYERHFGGAYYLFVRAMRPAHGRSAGVYFTRPARALIEALDAALYAGQAARAQKAQQ